MNESTNKVWDMAPATRFPVRLRLVGLVAAATLGSCGTADPPGGAIGSAEPEAALVFLERTSDNYCCSVRFEPLRSTADDWAEHEIIIANGQGEFVVNLYLPHRRYTLSDDMFIADGRADEETHRLAFDQEVPEITLVLPEELPPGEHRFGFAFDTQIEVLLPQGADVDPNEIAGPFTFDIIYTVQSATENNRLAGFCDNAVPLVNETPPSEILAESVIELADRELDRGERDRIVDGAEQLLGQIRAVANGTGDIVNGMLMAGPIGELCNTIVYSSISQS